MRTKEQRECKIRGCHNPRWSTAKSCQYCFYHKELMYKLRERKSYAKRRNKKLESIQNRERVNKNIKPKKLTAEDLLRIYGAPVSVEPRRKIKSVPMPNRHTMRNDTFLILSKLHNLLID